MGAKMDDKDIVDILDHLDIIETILAPFQDIDSDMAQVKEKLVDVYTTLETRIWENHEE